MSEIQFAENYQRHLELARARQKRWYEANGKQGAEKKRLKRQADAKELKELRKERAERDSAPACDSCQAEAEAEAEEAEPVVAPKPKRGRATYTLDQVIAELNKPDIGFTTDGSRKKCIADIKKVFDICKCVYFEQCVKKFDQIKKFIESAKKPDGTGYSLNTQLGYFYSIRWTYSHLPITIPDSVTKKYDALLNVYKLKSKAQTKENNASLKNSVLPQADYLARISNTFGKDSKQWLIVQLYLQCPCRDNLQLTVVNTVASAKKDKSVNYVVVPRSGNCKIILNKYKTASKYTDLNYDLDAGVSTLVRTWITTHKITYGNQLFTDKSLSKYISEMHKIIGVTGSINYIRHMIISNQNLGGMTLEQLVAEATKSGHSAEMHREYCRVVMASD